MCIFFLKKDPAFYEILKNTFFTGQLRTTASKF